VTHPREPVGEPLHVVGLSGGKDSTAMALWLKENEPRDYTYICTPTANEPAELFAHWKRLSELLGKPLTMVSSGLTLVGQIQHYNALPSHLMRWCTRQLKIEPTKAFLLTNAPAISYVGLRADEEEREGIYGEIAGVTQRYPLRELGWGVKDVWAYLNERGITIPKRTDCELCFFQRIGEWWDLWKNKPESYAEGEELETLTGYTFRAPGRDSWPSRLTDLRKRFELGEIPKARQQLSLGLDADRPEMCRACTL
jgi:3'-phosphoadenosine 5'-phosphosulfate sulfotransferase (PAPS reductase)/FAD synthetase